MPNGRLAARAGLLILLLALMAPAWAAPSAADRAFAAARQLLELENAVQAASAFEKFLADFPKDQRAYEASFMLGRAYQMQGKLDDALAAYTRVAQKAPSPGLDTLRAQAYFQMADCYWQQKQHAKVVSSCQMCLKYGDATLDLTARAYYWMGRSQAELGQVNEAQQSYTAVVVAAPKHPLAPWSLYAQALLAMKQGEHGQAIAALERIASEYKDSDVAGEATLALGIAYAARARGREQSAEGSADFGKAIQLLTAAQDLPALGPGSRLRATLALAEIYADRKDYDRAQALYGRAISAMPADQAWLPGARLQRGHALYNMGRFPEAAQEYARAAEGKDATVALQALYWLGNAYYQQAEMRKDPGAYADAAAAFRRFLAAGAKVAQAPRAGLLLALCLEALAELGKAARAEAVSAFKDVLEKWPASDEATQAQTGITRLAAAMSQAELEKVASGLPAGIGSWNVTLRLAQERFLAGSYEDAIAAAKKMLAEKPAGELLARGAYLAAAASQRLKRNEEAVAYYRQALASTADAEITLDAHRGLTQAYLDLGQLAKARETAQALIALPASGKDQAQKDADLAGRQMLLVEACLGEKRYAEAKEAASKVLASYPNTEQAPYAAMNLAWIEEAAQDTPGAVGAYRLLVTKYPRHKLAADAQLRLGLLLSEQKQPQQAIEALQQVPASHPQADQAAYALAWAYLDLGKEAEAVAQFERLADQFPRSPLAGDGLYHLGAYWMDKESYREAQRAFSRALELVGPDHKLRPPLTYKLGASAFNLGDFARAAEAFGTVVARYPASEVAAESLFWQGQALENRGAQYLAGARGAYLQYVKTYAAGPLVLDAALGAARVALTSKQYAVARAELKKALDMGEKAGEKDAALAERAKSVMPEAQFFLGQSYLEEKNYAEALAAYAGVAAYPLEPWYSRSLLQMARCSALSGDAAAAARTLRALVASCPDSDAAKQAPQLAEEYKLKLED